MALKIVKTPPHIKNGAGTRNAALREFVDALKVMKVGESVLLPVEVGSNFRPAISIAKMIIGAEYTTRTEGKNLRVARIA